MAYSDSITQTVATLWSIGRMTLAATSFVSPTTLANILGLGSAASTNAFIPLFGARNIALDLVILIFLSQRRLELAGLVTLCTVPVGMVDALVTWKCAGAGKASVHVVGTCGLALLGMSLLKGW